MSIIQSVIAKVSKLLAVALTVTGTASHAVPVTVSGTNYEVVAVTSSFNNLGPILKSQVWWNDVSLAEEFSFEVGFSLGIPNADFQGPYFAYANDTSRNVFFTATFQAFNGLNSTGSDIEVLADYFASSDQDFLFPLAVPISAIPLPAGGLMLLMALIGVVSLRRQP